MLLVGPMSTAGEVSGEQGTGCGPVAYEMEFLDNFVSQQESRRGVDHRCKRQRASADCGKAFPP